MLVEILKVGAGSVYFYCNFAGLLLYQYLVFCMGLIQGRIVRSRTLECSRVKVLRVEHSRVNLFDGQLKLFESCLLFCP